MLDSQGRQLARKDAENRDEKCRERRRKRQDFLERESKRRRGRGKRWGEKRHTNKKNKITKGFASVLFLFPKSKMHRVRSASREWKKVTSRVSDE